MQILVCGGRDFSDGGLLWKALHAVHQKHVISLIIHGAARGADTLGGEWAAHMGIPCKVFPAYWSTHGKAAGSIRNQQMLDEGKPDAVVAFAGGRGTADMVRRAKNAGIPVWEVNSTAP